MISCNINIICSKCYLKFIKIVPVKMESVEPLVRLAMLLKLNVMAFLNIKKITYFHSQNLELTRSVYL